MSDARMTSSPPYSGSPNLSHQWAAGDVVVETDVLAGFVEVVNVDWAADDTVDVPVWFAVEVVDVQETNTGTTTRIRASKTRSVFLFIFYPFIYLFSR